MTPSHKITTHKFYFPYQSYARFLSFLKWKRCCTWLRFENNCALQIIYKLVTPQAILSSGGLWMLWRFIFFRFLILCKPRRDFVSLTKTASVINKFNGSLVLLFTDQIVPSIWSLNCSPTSDLPDHIERYSRKVFVGGLPPDIDEGMVTMVTTTVLIYRHAVTCCCGACFCINYKFRFFISYGNKNPMRSKYIVTIGTLLN